MDVGQLRRELKAGTYQNVYLLCGPETFIVEEALNLLIEALLPPEEHDLGVVRLYADEVRVDEVLDEARTMPFFGGRRIVVVRRIEAWDGIFAPRRKATSSEEQNGGEVEREAAGKGKLDAQRKNLLDYISNPNPTTHLILVTKQVDGRLPIVRLLKTMGAVVECNVYTQDAAIRWVKERVRTLGCNLSPEAMAFLVEHVGPDLQRLSRELDKLTEHGSGGAEVGTEAIERLVVGDRERRVFELTDAIGRQDVETALRRLETLLTIGEGQGPLPPLRVLSSLAWQVRSIWLVKDSTKKGLSDLEAYNRTIKAPVKGLSAWHKRRLRGFQETAERFSEANLSSALQRLLQADGELKGEGTSNRRALETLVMDLCASG